MDSRFRGNDGWGRCGMSFALWSQRIGINRKHWLGGGPTMSVKIKTSMRQVQIAAEYLVEVQIDEQEDALELLAEAILDHFGYTYETGVAVEILFSRELPLHIQRFGAAWLLRILTEDGSALDFERARAQTAALFDRTLEETYKRCGISVRNLTYEKINALTEYAHLLFEELTSLVEVPPALSDLDSLQAEVLQLLTYQTHSPLLSQMFPDRVMNRNRISSLFRSVRQYSTVTNDADLISAAYSAYEACDDYESEVGRYELKDANRILGGLARQLKASVKRDFEATEKGKPPRLSFSPIIKKYPLQRPGASITIKVQIFNNGLGPARDLQLDQISSDNQLNIRSPSTVFGTISPGDSYVFDIIAEVAAPSERSTVQALLTSLRLGERVDHPLELTIESQRENVDWESVEAKEPYSLEAVVSDDDLVGRRRELLQLMRHITVPTVGSAFIYGQKRVGKTSLANAVKNRLEKLTDEHWVVIYKGSGEYYGIDAASTLRQLGEELARSLLESLPQMCNAQVPDFSDGIAPLAILVDEALKCSDKVLFILDEFDELPLDLVDKSKTISSSLFMPLREISTRDGCGFLLVGGEGLRQIMTQQGDRLNKFDAVEVDYFTKSEHWSDFAELIRRPVQDWLEISDTALDTLYESCAGNPYFAKLLASQLALDMVESRFTNASEVDMVAAIDKKRSGIVASSFAHFWSDGLIEHSGDVEQIRTIRRSVLIAAGRAFRKAGPVDSQKILQEFKETDFTRVGEERFRTTLQDFFQRKILVQNQRNEITAKIPLFQSWLMGRGVEELLPTGRESDLLGARLRHEERERIKDYEILEFCESAAHFHYRGKTAAEAAIRRWLEQFDTPSDQRLMFRLLYGMRFYDETLMRTKMREAMGIVERGMEAELLRGREFRHRGILVITLDASAAKGGYTYCRLFTDEHNILASNAMPLGNQMEQALTDARTQRLLLIDDFAGTGTTLVRGLEKAMPYLRLANDKGIPVTLFAVAGFAHARDRIEEFIDNQRLNADVHFCDTLGREHQVFSSDSIIFPEVAERERAKQIVEEKGQHTGNFNPLGYDGTQATIVFYSSCPNNTLPIFWSNNGDWTPLFARYAASSTDGVSFETD